MKKVDLMKKILRIIMLILFVFIVIYGVLTILPNKKTKKESEEIDKAGSYVLYKRDTELYKEVFTNLKEVLDNEVDYEKYAEYMSELFIIDLYTLNNKDNKNDVGGVQFLYDSIKDNFILNASGTMYKYISELKEKPEVKSIELKNIEENKYKINDKEYNGYKVSLNWEYVEDYNYDKSCVIYLINENDKLYIVEMNHE